MSASVSKRSWRPSRDQRRAKRHYTFCKTFSTGKSGNNRCSHLVSELSRPEHGRDVRRHAHKTPNHLVIKTQSAFQFSSSLAHLFIILSEIKRTAYDFKTTAFWTERNDAGCPSQWVPTAPNFQLRKNRGQSRTSRTKNPTPDWGLKRTR